MERLRPIAEPDQLKGNFMTKDGNVIGTIQELISDAILLVRQEVNLARAEAEEKMEQMQTGIAAVAAGLVLAGVALIVLTQALVVALANLVPPSVAALIVGVIMAIIAFIAVSRGVESLKPENLKPRRTIKSVRESADKIREAS